jgi:hypothetical protein
MESNYTQYVTIWEYIVNHGITSNETLQVVTTLNGETIETLNRVLYVLTGYRDIEQYENEHAIEYNIK